MASTPHNSKNYWVYTAPTNSSDTVSGSFSTLLGTSNNPSLIATGKSDVLIAGNGNVTLSSAGTPANAYSSLIGNGSSTLIGGSGKTYFQFSSGDYIASSSGGGDTLASATVPVIDLTDTSTLGPGVRSIGNAIYTGTTGATLKGNTQNGSLTGGTLGGNSLVAGSASQTLISRSKLGSSSADTLVGNGKSSLIGGSGLNIYVINDAPDNKTGRSDTIIQGPTSDASPASIRTSLTSFSLTDTIKSGANILNIKKLVFTNNTLASGTISLTGNAASILIQGATLTNNILTSGKNSKASLLGGLKSDTLIGSGYSTLYGNGSSTISGGDADIYYVSGSSNGLQDQVVNYSNGGSILGLPQGNTPFYYNLTPSKDLATLTGLVPISKVSYLGTANATLVGNTLEGNTIGDTLVGGGGTTYTANNGQVVPGNSLVSGLGGGSLVGGSKGNRFNDSLTTSKNSTIQSTFVGGIGNDTYDVGNRADTIIEPVSGGFGGTDQVNTPLTNFSLAATNVGGGNSVENLTYDPSLIDQPTPLNDTLVVQLSGNALSNVLDAGTVTSPTSKIASLAPLHVVFDGGSGLDTLIGTQTSNSAGSNLFLISSPSFLGQGIQVKGNSVISGINDTLSITVPITSLSDKAFGPSGNTVPGNNFVSNVQHLLLSSSSAATLGVAAQTAGIKEVSLVGQGPDTVDASGYSSFGITLDASQNQSPSGDFLKGSSSKGSRFKFSSADAISKSTIIGGSDIGDSLEITSPLSNFNDAFTSSDASIEYLLLSGDSLSQANNIVIGSNAQNAGINYVSLSAGADSVDASGYTNRGITLDATRNTTNANSLIGSSSTLGSSFLFSSGDALKVSTIKGGSGKDTLTVTTLLRDFSDGFNSSDSGIEVLSLSSSQFGNNIKLGANAQTAGINDIIAGSQGDTIDASDYSLPLTLDASSSTSIVNLTGSYSAKTTFLIGQASLVNSSTFVGGSNSDSLGLTAPAKLGDSSFGGLMSGIDALLLLGSSSSTLSSAVTLDAAANSEGLTMVAGGNGNGSLSVTQLLGHTLPSVFLAGSAPALFAVSTRDQLITDTIFGGSSSLGDTLQIPTTVDTLTAPTTLTATLDSTLGGPSTISQTLSPTYALSDSIFGNIKNIEFLKLSGPSTLALGSLAGSAGISTVLGSGVSTIPGGYTLSNTVGTVPGASSIQSTSSDWIDSSDFTNLLTVDLSAFASASTIGDTILTGRNGSNIIVPKVSQISSNSIIGGSGSDTLTILNTGQLLDSLLGSGISGLDAISVNAGSAVILGSLAAASGIKAVYSGAPSTLSQTLGSTLAQSSLDSNPSRLEANSGNDSLFIGTSDLLVLDTILGGAGINTLTVGVASTSTVANTLSDASFANVTLASGSLSSGYLSLVGNAYRPTVNGVTGNSLGSGVTLGANAAKSGIASVFGGNANSTISLTSEDTLPSLLLGGSGNNLFILNNQNQISLHSLNGGSGNTTLQVSSLSTLGDTVFTNDKAIRALQLSTLGTSLQGNAVTLKSSAGNAGISTVVTGPNSDTINAASATQSITIDARAIQSNTKFSFAGSSLGSAFVFNSDTVLGIGSLIAGKGTDTLAFATSSTLQDVKFANITSIEALSLSGSSDVTLGGSSAKAGIRRVVMTDTFNNSTLIGKSSVTQLVSNPAILISGGPGNDLFNISNSALLLNDSISGGGGNDTIALGAYETLGDTLFQPSRISNVKALQLLNSPTAGSSSVTLGSLAGNSGLSTIITGRGADVVNASLDNKPLTIDASAGISLGQRLTGSSLGTAFLFSNTKAFSASTLAGGPALDTLTFTAPVSISDTLFSSKSVSVEVLRLTDNSLASSSATLGALAKTTGIRTVITGAGADTVIASDLNLPATLGPVTLDASAAVTNGVTLQGSSTMGSVFQLSNGQVFAQSSIVGGSASDTLILSSGTSLNDSVFGRASSVEALSLSSASSVTLSSSAARLGLKSVSLSGNSAFIQNSADTLPISISAASGTNLLGFDNPSLLSADSISGSGGNNTLALLSYSTLVDTQLSRVASGSMQVLSLASASSTLPGGYSATLGANAQRAGLNRITTSSGSDTINAALYTGNVVFDASKTSSGAILSGGSVSGASSTFLFASSNAFASSTLVGGAGSLDGVSLSTSTTLTDQAFFNKSSLDQVTLGGSASLSFDTLAANAGIRTVYLTDSLANDTVTYNSSFTQLAADTLVTTVVAGAGNDIFSLANQTLLASDSLVGGTGVDSLFLSGALTSFNDSFQGSGIEVLSLSGILPNSATLASKAQAFGISTVLGGDSGNTLSHALNNSIGISFAGGISNDFFAISTLSQLSSDTISGNGGVDTLAVNLGSSTLTDARFSNLAGLELLSLSGSTASNVSLDSLASAAGFTTIVGTSGGNTITQGVNFTNALSMTGGSGNDLFSVQNLGQFLSDSINGVSGTDTLQILAGSTLNDAFNKISGSGNKALILGSNAPNNVTLSTYAQAANVTTVLGGNGNNTFVQTSSDTLATTLVGGTGLDSFSLATQTQLVADSIVGGSGTDTLQIAAALTAFNDSFKGSGVELLSLASGSANSVTLNGNAQTFGLATVYGGNGGNSFAQGNSFNSALTLTGGSGADSFSLSTQAQLVTDSIVGGSGTDTLQIAAALIAFNDSLNGSGVEILSLASGSANSVTLNGNAQTFGLATVLGGNNGNSLTQANDFTNAMSLGGGSANDLFVISNQAQFALDSINAGAGSDTLFISSGFNLSDAFGNVSGLEILSLSDASSSVTLGTSGQTAGISSVFGGAATTVLDASAYSTRGAFLNNQKALGASTLVGGSLNDSLSVSYLSQFASSSINGGNGSDTLILGGQVTGLNDGFGRISNVEVLALIGPDSLANDVTLSNLAQAAGIGSLVGGNAVNRIWENTGFSNSLSIFGGLSNDAFILSTQSQFLTDSIAGGLGVDTVTVLDQFSGITDSFSKLSGVEVLSLAGANNLATLDSNAQNAGLSTVVGGNQGNTLTQSSGWTTPSAMFGGSGNDSFSIATQGQVTVDTLVGNGGLDTLNIVGPLSNYNDSFTQFADIQTLILSGSANSVTLNGNAQNEGFANIIGGNSGNSLTQGANFINPLTVTGGTGNDLVALANQGQLLTDSLSGLSGIDTLAFSSGVSLTGSEFSSTIVSGMEVLSLVAGTASGISNVTLGTANQNIYSTVIGGALTFTIDVSAYTTPTTIDGNLITAPATLIGGANNDSFLLTNASRMSSVTIVGNSGSDSLALTTATTVTDSAFASISTIEALTLTGASSVTFDSLAQRTGIASIFGGTGNSTFTQTNGFTNPVTIAGGIGNDLFVLSSTLQVLGDSISGGNGTDTLAFSAPVTFTDGFSKVIGVEVLSLNGASQVTLGSSGQTAGISTVVGGTGVNLVDASAYSTSRITVFDNSGTGSSTLLGGSLGDLFVLASQTQLSTDSLVGGAGINTLQITGAITTLNDSFRGSGEQVLSLAAGSANSATLSSNAQTFGIQTVYGGNSGDTLTQGAGFTNPLTLVGGTGNDAFVVSTQTQLAADSLVGGAGANTISLSGALTAFNDTFKGSGEQVLSLVAGSANTATFSANASTLGLQTIYGGNSGDVLTQGAGFTNALTLIGGSGNDSFVLSTQAQLAADSLVGGGGSANVISLAGALSAFNDTFKGSGEQVLSLFAGSANTATFSANASTLGLQTIYGGNSGDVLTQGAGFTNALTLIGGSGNDSFILSSTLQATTDSISGGAGTDTLAFSAPATLNNAFSSISGVEVLSLNGASQVTLGASGQTSGISTVIGGSATTSLDASAYTTTAVTLNNSASTVSSTLLGGSAADSLIGGTGIDTLRGYSGTATSNTVNDTMRGGAGADLFIMAVIGDTNNAYGRGASNTAYVTDFTAGAGGDKIQLHQFGAGSNDYSTLTSGSNLNIYHTSTQTTANLVAVLTPTGTFDWTNNASFL